jgi:hypothetical protein
MGSNSRSLTHLTLEENNLTLTGIDSTVKSEEMYLQNLTYLSLRGNPVGQGSILQNTSSVEKFLEFFCLKNYFLS